MTTYSLKIETEPAHADVRFLLDRLYFYNVERARGATTGRSLLFSREIQRTRSWRVCTGGLGEDG
jgi:hypothetical protein